MSKNLDIHTRIFYILGCKITIWGFTTPNPNALKVFSSSKRKKKKKNATTVGCNLTVEVFKLLHLMSSSSVNPNKIPIVHIILSITVI